MLVCEDGKLKYVSQFASPKDFFFLYFLFCFIFKDRENMVTKFGTGKQVVQWSLT